MKTLLLTIALNFAPFVAQAESILPNTSRFLFQETASLHTKGVANAPRARREVRNQVQERLEQLKKPSGEPIDFRFLCQTVYLQFEPDETVQSGNGPELQRGLQCIRWSDCNFLNISRVNVFCEERDFVQRVALSAQQACEREPKPECMSPAYLEMFRKIKPTQFEDSILR